MQTNANGTTTTKTYDAERSWLTGINTAGPAMTLQNLQYTLNGAGIATAVNSDVTNEDWTHAYDEMNRLTSSTNGVPANNQTWTDITTPQISGGVSYFFEPIAQLPLRWGSCKS